MKKEAETMQRKRKIGDLEVGLYETVISLYHYCPNTSVADLGSGIGCLFDPWIRDPEWEKVSIRIRDEQPGSYFLEL
jgi:hypothetical protein